MVPWAELLNHENVSCTFDIYVNGNLVNENEIKQMEVKGELIKETAR
jgi:hypothetical protein